MTRKVIDADKLCERLAEVRDFMEKMNNRQTALLLQSIINGIKKEPAVVVGQIVCAECKHYARYANVKTDRGLCRYFMKSDMPKDAYCSFAERKDNGRDYS